MLNAIKKVNNYICEYDAYRSIYLMCAMTFIFLGVRENALFTDLSLCFLVLCSAFPELLRNKLFWIFPAFLWILSITQTWDVTGNQKFVTVYIIMTLYVSLFFNRPESEKIILDNFIGLMILIFGVALMWKLSSENFRSGDFIHHLIIATPMFDTVNHVFLKINNIIITIFNLSEVNYKETLSSRQGLNNSIIFDSTLVHYWGAKIITFISLIVHIMISFGFVCYLITKKKIYSKIAHIGVIEFCLMAYGTTKIIGFGWILCVMGYYIAHHTNPKMKPYYICTMIIVTLYHIDFQNLLNGELTLFKA